MHLRARPKLELRVSGAVSSEFLRPSPVEWAVVLWVVQPALGVVRVHSPEADPDYISARVSKRIGAGSALGHDILRLGLGEHPESHVEGGS